MKELHSGFSITILYVIKMKETKKDIQIHKCLWCGVNVQPTIGMLHMTIHYHLEQIYKVT